MKKARHAVYIGTIILCLCMIVANVAYANTVFIFEDPKTITRGDKEVTLTNDSQGGLSQLFSNLESIQKNNRVKNGSFEEPYITGWNIFPEIKGWTSTMGAGIEIENNVVMPASEGFQLAELDSHNNSNMIQSVCTRGAGEFTLSFDYSPRPGVPKLSNPVEVWWDDVLMGTITGDSAGWVTQTYYVKATKAYTKLEFRAIGTQDSLGGFIDNVIVLPMGNGANQPNPCDK